MDCEVQYKDPARYLCPCYSKMSQCLVQIGCNMRQKIEVMATCTRKGYCKDGYCKFRAGDLTPKIDTRGEVFELTSVKAPGTPCIDNCCPLLNGTNTCHENATMAALRQPSRDYRRQEVLLPPREGDPRLGVNQQYDRMPYSIPIQNLP
ncbi:TPA: hypothetical protein N0F65_008498 [Lagenidium giganteum]|uniref:Uncharacterized protein n=1 Tax=Lagenidium giganteum TaxID=4803 RepID=A0AAV2Z4X5_9STRA|nr:TPA: hypothetical protein N0F65_008498 [Lagenidium giganteum]